MKIATVGLDLAKSVFLRPNTFIVASSGPRMRRGDDVYADSPRYVRFAGKYWHAAVTPGAPSKIGLLIAYRYRATVAVRTPTT
jgi:hypothetical protein